MKNVFVKPAVLADGSPALVRDPQSGVPLDPAGDYKPMSQFWIRRIRDGDVIEADPPRLAPPSAAPLPSISPID